MRWIISTTGDRSTCRGPVAPTARWPCPAAYLPPWVFTPTSCDVDLGPPGRARPRRINPVRLDWDVGAFGAGDTRAVAGSRSRRLFSIGIIDHGHRPWY